MLLGLILAAGKGKRYGSPKVTAENGAWLRSCVMALQQGGCDEIRVLLGAALVEVPPPALPMIVPNFSQGLSRTLLAGIEFALHREAAAVVIIPVDMPGITARVIRRLCEDTILRNTQMGDLGSGYSQVLARVVCEGMPRHPVLIGSSFFPELIQFLFQAEGIAQDEGAKGFLQEHQLEVLLVECADLMDGKDYDYPE